MPCTLARLGRIALFRKTLPRSPRLDQRPVHRKVLLAQQVVFLRLLQHSFQQLLAHRARDQTFPVLAEHCRIPHHVVHLQTHEPAEQQVVVQLLHQLPLRPYRVQHHHQQRTQKPLRRNRRTARRRVQLVQLDSNIFQNSIRQNTNLTNRMILRYTTLQRYITEHRRLLLVESTHTSFLQQLPVHGFLPRPWVFQHPVKPNAEFIEICQG